MISNRSIALLGLFAITLASAAHAMGKPPAAEIDTQIWQRTTCSHGEAGDMIAWSEREWVDTWKHLGEPAPFSINEGEEVGVGVFMGIKRTGGYSVELLSAHMDGEDLVVRIREAEPGPEAFVIQMLTTPCAMILVRAHAENVIVIRAGD